MLYMHNKILFGLHRAPNPVICNSVCEPGTHYVKQNKPGPERQIPHGLIHAQSRKTDPIGEAQ